MGNTSNATQGRDLYRYTFTDNLTWQKGSHRIRFGTELEHAPGTGFWGYCDPSCDVAASPELIRSVVPAALVGAFFPNLPTVIRTNADLLNLPFLGGIVGVGADGRLLKIGTLTKLRPRDVGAPHGPSGRVLTPITRFQHRA